MIPKKSLFEEIESGTISVSDIVKSGKVNGESVRGSKKYILSYPIQSRWRELWDENDELADRMAKLTKEAFETMQKLERAKHRMWAVVEEDTRDRRPMFWSKKDDCVYVKAKEEDAEDEE